MRNDPQSHPCNTPNRYPTNVSLFRVDKNLELIALRVERCALTSVTEMTTRYAHHKSMSCCYLPYDWWPLARKYVPPNGPANRTNYNRPSIRLVALLYYPVSN